MVRDDAGAVVRVVEARDASAADAEIREINAGIFMFDRAALTAALGRVGSSNAQGEIYLPDVLPRWAAPCRRWSPTTPTSCWESTPRGPGGL